MKSPTEEDKGMTLGDLQRFRPEPGDVFVLRVDARIDAEMADTLKRSWRRAIGNDVGAKLIVLGKGMTIEMMADPLA